MPPNASINGSDVGIPRVTVFGLRSLGRRPQVEGWCSKIVYPRPRSNIYCKGIIYIMGAYTEVNIANIMYHPFGSFDRVAGLLVTIKLS